MQRAKRPLLLIAGKTLLVFLLLLLVGSQSLHAVEFTNEALPEATVKSTIREMLAKHLPYAESKFVASSGYFGNGQNTEHGARTNADYALVYAFIYKYCKDQTLPNGLTFETIRQHALAALRYSYKTHATGTINCTNGVKWGLVWESSMWCTSTAYASWILADELTDADKAAVKAMVVAEANYNLNRTIPTAFRSDTKAEENGWDTNILSIAATMYPGEKNAEAWDYRNKQFAMNTYSVAADLKRNSKKTDKVDGKTIADWHIGANLFDDFALENHNFFHTSYLNIPIQELSESLLAYKAIQDPVKPAFKIPQALSHNVLPVWNSMLKSFIMADGILAMPNGNDWSMYIYDELGTYSALACIYRDPDALMLESMVLKWARFRQTTTTDGAFLLNPDVAERRMGVTARRLVFAHLYHDYFPTSNLTATLWSDFSKRHEATKYLPYNGIIRSNNDSKYVTFSWFQSADGTSYKSYMGMVSPNNMNYSNVIFPFKAGNMGNFTGYTDVTGYTRNASLVSNNFSMYPNSFSTTGKLSVTSGSLQKYLAFYNTPGNAAIYHEEMLAGVSATIAKDGGLMQGITTDVLTQPTRTLYNESGSISADGSTVVTIPGNWVNVDNVYGMVVEGGNGMAFGEKELSTSVYVSKLYGSYSKTAKSMLNGQSVYNRSSIVYPGVNAETTRRLAPLQKYPVVGAGWKATAAEDPDGKRYLLISNFRTNSATNISLSYPEGAPVFDRVTTVIGTTGTARFNCMMTSSATNELYAFIKTGARTLKAVQGDNPYRVYVVNENSEADTAVVSIWDNGTYKNSTLILPAAACQLVQVQNGTITSSDATFPGDYRNISLGRHILADDQLPEHFPFAMIDEDDSTWYQSMNLPTASVPQKITCRLWNLNSIDKLMIKSKKDLGPKEIDIQVSLDGSTFTTVGTATLKDTEDWQTVSFTASDAKYFRIRVFSTFGANNVGITAVRMYGSPK